MGEKSMNEVEQAVYDELIRERGLLLTILNQSVPMAIGHNTIPRMVQGLVNQRNNFKDERDHLADTARKLTHRAEAAESRVAQLTTEHTETYAQQRAKLVQAHNELLAAESRLAHVRELHKRIKVAERVIEIWNGQLSDDRAALCAIEDGQR
jgi:DNA repair exonuclease SbcCD ATPase subunit